MGGKCNVEQVGSLGFGAWGLGLGAWGLGFWAWGLGCNVKQVVYERKANINHTPYPDS